MNVPSAFAFRHPRGRSREASPQFFRLSHCDAGLAKNRADSSHRQVSLMTGDNHGAGMAFAGKDIMPRAVMIEREPRPAARLAQHPPSSTTRATRPQVRAQTVKRTIDADPCPSWWLSMNVFSSLSDTGRPGDRFFWAAVARASRTASWRFRSAASAVSPTDARSYSRHKEAHWVPVEYGDTGQGVTDGIFACRLIELKPNLNCHRSCLPPHIVAAGGSPDDPRQAARKRTVISV